jgi:CRISPR-associated protein Cas2
MSAEKRWRLVCYDVRDDARYRKVFKIVRGAGESVQYSVFRCRLDDLEAERLRWRLSEVMDPEDALLIVDLCPRCARKIVARNQVDGWEEDPATFRILGPTRAHSAPAVTKRRNQGSVAAPRRLWS